VVCANDRQPAFPPFHLRVWLRIVSDISARSSLSVDPVVELEKNFLNLSLADFGIQ
jgi:hypothetical protein